MIILLWFHANIFIKICSNILITFDNRLINSFMNTLLNLIFWILQLRGLEQHLWRLKGQFSQINLRQIWQPDHIAAFVVGDVLDFLIIIQGHIAVFFLGLFHVFELAHFFSDLALAFFEDFLLEVFSQVVSAHVHFQNGVG